uniref:DH domain-containing protein n=1 Tax=Eptatretus burgeri TaxID=7764 RepID=A0A8C4QRI8_EPTBU
MDVVTGLAPNDSVSDVLANLPRETDFAKRDTEMDLMVESSDRRETHVVPQVTREENTVKSAGSRRNSETIDVHVRQRQKRARGKWGDRKVCTGNGETTMTAGHVDISTPSNDKRFLRRVRSATFITPAPQPDFTLRRRKRKCLEDADAVSLCSLDMKEPSSKRVRPLSRVASLASLITPVKGVNVRRFGQNLQRSISLRADGPGPASAAKPYSKQSVPPTPRHRLSRLWSDTYKAGVHHELSRTEIKRQEAIFELAQGEHDLIDDLKLAKKAYHDPMLKLNIMSKEELNEIFGALESLIPLHEALLSQLHKARLPDGTTESIGQILVDWPRTSSVLA